ncbi:MAG TPA: hypothetical protein VF541_09400 [Longimicrobium sp.]
MVQAELARVPEVPARLVFMGGQASEARARVLDRTPRWRRSRALRDLLLVLVAPAAFVVPPHVIWPPILALIGVILAFNHIREHRTLLSLHGPCPKCGAEQEFRELGRMGSPHKVTCAQCRWDLYVDVPRASEAT